MSPEPYGRRVPVFFSLHYSGSDLTDATRLDMPLQNVTSLQVRGRAGDGNIYSVSLSGANNVFGRFVMVGSPLQEETPPFRELVHQMEKRHSGKARTFTYALNEHRQTAFIQTGKPAAFVDLIELDGLLRQKLLMRDLKFDLYFDGLKNKPRANVLGKVDIRGYTVQENSGFVMTAGNAKARQTYYTRTYLDEKGQPEE